MKNKKITLPILLPQFNTYLGNRTLKSATFYGQKRSADHQNSFGSHFRLAYRFQTPVTAIAFQLQIN